MDKQLSVSKKLSLKKTTGQKLLVENLQGLGCHPFWVRQTLALVECLVATTNIKMKHVDKYYH